jgi:mannose-1-phosphate guanylyltransferase
MARVFAVIMAGGRGERLWPLSTPKRPKQFLKLRGQKTMLQETVARISPLIPKESIYMVAPKEFTRLVCEQLDIPRENIIVEPMGRNTAPCVGLAATMLEAKDPQSVMVVLPADHVIKERERFLRILAKATEVAAAEDYLVTLGIVPDRPATGYGYIRRGELLARDGEIEICRAERFIEKPNHKTAERFLEEGGYYWNSGIFIWRADVILAELERHLPELYSGLMRIKEHLGKPKPDLDRVIEEVYKEQESISIDYGVMERSSRVLVIPADIGWSDLGDWSALEAIFEKDGEGNIIQARHLGIDTKDSIIFADKGKLIATIGLEGIVIIETERALLVMNKARAQEVREIVKRLGP